MPKGRKRAIKAALGEKGEEEAEEVGQDDEFMMELEAARAAMEEQTQKREERRAEVEAAKATGLYNKVGLQQKVEEMSRNIPWEERLTVCEFPLELENVHDDLNREVAFYQNALEAVKRGRAMLVEAGVPYKRPDDFFCEMMKTDTHMDKVKDKLIFEQQKMDAFEKRKARLEQRKYAKELSSAKQAEKSKRKRDELEQIEEWKKSTKRARAGGLEDDDGLDDVLSGGGARGGGGGAGKGMSREARDKKFGFGGKKRKKGASDPRSLDDFRSFNPRQGGSGRSRKLPAKGKSRPGKSVRTQNRKRRARSG